MELIYVCCPGILHVLKFLIFFSNILALPGIWRKYKKSILFAATVIFSMLMNLLRLPVLGKAVLYAAFIFGIMIFLYEGSKKKLAAGCLWSICTVGILDEIAKVAVNMLFWSVRIDTRDAELAARFVRDLVTLSILLFVGTQMQKRHGKDVQHLSVPFFLGFSLLCTADLVLLVPLGEFASDHEFRQGGVFQFIFLFVAFGTLLQIAMVMLLALSKNVYQEKERIAAKYLEEQKKHYEYLQKREAGD